jgi:sulfur relay protein TusB/DsrH
MSSSASDAGVLHLVGRPQALREALALAAAGDALVLLEDAAPLAVAARACPELDAAPAGLRVHALAADLAARGVGGIDYAALVDLAAIQRASVSWW